MTTASASGASAASGVLHRAFIVRCWAEPGADGVTPIWRYSVQEMPDGRRLGFAQVEEMLRCLGAQVEPRAEA